jgi:hypothetical protein
MRNNGDILADGVIAELFARSEIDQVNAFDEASYKKRVPRTRSVSSCHA